jgi:NADH:ubiquinone oxidoreductase subunit 6 (subunit J)
MTVLITILAAVTLSGAVAAMTLRNLVHCALALTIAFAGLATLYLSLDAQFAGLAQLLVYVGAIAILIVFAILLTPSVPESALKSKPHISPSGLVGIALAGGVFSILAWSVTHSGTARSVVATDAPSADMQQIGDTLMHRYILPLEVIGLMLTAALIGAVIVAMKESQAPR